MRAFFYKNKEYLCIITKMTSMKKYTTLALMLACMACSEEKASDSTLTKLKIKDLEHEETARFWLLPAPL